VGAFGGAAWTDVWSFWLQVVILFGVCVWLTWVVVILVARVGVNFHLFQMQEKSKCMTLCCFFCDMALVSCENVIVWLVAWSGKQICLQGPREEEKRHELSHRVMIEVEICT
jgi:hypothetical protein